MQCAKFEQRLQQLMDDRVDASHDEALRQHAETCEGCHSLLQAQEALLVGLQVTPHATISKDLGHRVIDEILIDQKRRRKRRITLVAMAIAAMLFVALLPLAGGRTPWQTGPESAGPGLAIALHSNSESDQRELTEEEAAELRLLMRQLVMRLSDPNLDMLESVDQLATGIRPLTATFNFAIDALRRTLPGYSDDSDAIEPQAHYRKLHATIG